jgi:hypothetical protein
MKHARSGKNTSDLLAIAMSGLLAAACATAPTMEGPKIPPAGATWTNAQTLAGSFGSGNKVVTTTMGEGTWQGKTMRAFHSGANWTFINSDFCWVGMAAAGKPIFTWDPPICYRYPIAVGKTWSEKRRLMIHPAKRTIALESTWKVEAYEEVSVPAGTFGAFRISYSDNNGTDRVDWYSPDLGVFVKSNVKRSAKHPSGPGSVESMLVSQTIAK